jgi:hypothetical protein
MKKHLLFFICLSFFSVSSLGQGFPWNNPLKIAWSSDGITFNTSTIFQDSSGVPSVIKWKGDALLAVFQWFRSPNPSTTWDRVAVKHSFDNGITWTPPMPIVINGIPSSYQRAFDPTLTVINDDSLRIFFSSSDGIPSMGLDSSVNTYSATTTDGINYSFEPGPRVDEILNRVIDPAVISFKNLWHYASPIGAPQQGAYHYISSDGFNFTAVPVILSDNLHNWTGNYLVEDSSELRFYGSGFFIWYNSSPNGGNWNGYVNTNIQGGDPSVAKISINNYLMIYVGLTNPNEINENINHNQQVSVFPNPVIDIISINLTELVSRENFIISDMIGKKVFSGKVEAGKTNINISHLRSDFYILTIGELRSTAIKILKQ